MLCTYFTYTVYNLRVQDCENNILNRTCLKPKRNWEETLTCVQLGNCRFEVEIEVFVHQECRVEMRYVRWGGNVGQVNVSSQFLPQACGYKCRELISSCKMVMIAYNLVIRAIRS